MLCQRSDFRENDAKESKNHKKRLFTYSFAIMDLETRLYIALSSSMKLEREAYDRAMDLLTSIGIEMDSMRLDRYYSSPSYLDKLGDTKVFVIQMIGWNIAQKRDDRIDNALFCTGVWHNLFNMGRS